MAWPKQRRKLTMNEVVHGLPIEILPIPYTITDFGRAYLRIIELMEEEEARAVAAQRYIELQLLQPVSRHSR